MFILLPFKLHATCFEFLTIFIFWTSNSYRDSTQVLLLIQWHQFHHAHPIIIICTIYNIPYTFTSASGMVIDNSTNRTLLIRPFAKWIWLYIDASSNANTFNSMLIALHTAFTVILQYWTALDHSFHFTYRTLNILIYYQNNKYEIRNIVYWGFEIVIWIHQRGGYGISTVIRICAWHS